MTHSVKILLALILSFFFVGCDGKAPAQKKELLIFCGTSMAKPMQEVASLFEAEHKCMVKIIQGGSGSLLKSIKVNGLGDLYLPGDETYMDKSRKQGLVTKIVTVGINHLALIVQKNNPLAITADLNHLADKNYRVVLASAKSSSIGRVAEEILRHQSIYSQVMDNVLFLTRDTKGLTQAIKENKADLTISWYATAQWPENSNFIDALPLCQKVALIQKLSLGLLRFSSQPDLAKGFMELAVSKQGQQIFSLYGFHFHKDSHETKL